MYYIKMSGPSQATVIASRFTQCVVSGLILSCALVKRFTVDPYVVRVHIDEASPDAAPDYVCHLRVS